MTRAELRALARRAEGMDDAAAIVETHAKAAKNCADESDLIRPIREGFLQKHFALAEAAKDIRQQAAALRAMAEEPHDA